MRRHILPFIWPIFENIFQAIKFKIDYSASYSSLLFYFNNYWVDFISVSFGIKLKCVQVVILSTMIFHSFDIWLQKNPRPGLVSADSYVYFCSNDACKMLTCLNTNVTFYTSVWILNVYVYFLEIKKQVSITQLIIISNFRIKLIILKKKWVLRIGFNNISNLLFLYLVLL